MFWNSHWRKDVLGGGESSQDRAGGKSGMKKDRHRAGSPHCR
jgi:hypothetical protein